MGVTTHLVEMMEGYSKALYSSFFLFRNYDLLFDCGEGCAARLDRHQFRARWVCISHYHHDHSGGLKGLFLARAYTKGSNDREMTIYYPEGSPSMERLRRWLERDLPRLPFPLEWAPVSPGFRLRVSQQGARVPIDLEAFAADHYAREACLGFRIVEGRKRLKPEYAGLLPNEIARIAHQTGHDSLMEDYEKTILVYSGDSAPLPVEIVRGADLLLHDATFLSERDREEPGHASVEQVLTLARVAEVSGVMLVHTSHRYSLRTVRKAMPRLLRRTGYQGDVWIQWLDRPERLDGQESAPGENAAGEGVRRETHPPRGTDALGPQGTEAPL
ncbi:MAG: MBL fold metallo-hydrolase [Candidatus Eisenbacteria bacterium]|nr:MBL fold metallo-hydrolase [Candidatus Eisenbacteria bacterium]